MDPARFVTACFVYCGLALLGMNAVLLVGDGLTPAVAANGLAACCILLTGVHRLYSVEAEVKPERYGAFAYGMATFAVLATILLLASIAVVV